MEENRCDLWGQGKFREEEVRRKTKTIEAGKQDIEEK